MKSRTLFSVGSSIFTFDLCIAASLFGQSALDGFDPNANGIVQTMAVQADGKIVIGGGFHFLTGVVVHDRIARINIDGTLDRAFAPRANGNVQTVAVQPDGKILLGGSFFTVNSTARAHLARLHPDGNLDMDFTGGVQGPGLSGSPWVGSLALQRDGKILLGGYFNRVKGEVRNRLARLNADGSVDLSFRADADGEVHAVLIQADGKIVVGGVFSTLSGQMRANLGRLHPDGSLDTFFNPGANQAVLAFAEQPDEKIVVAGGFTTLDGLPRSRIGRLNAAGRLDTSFNASGENIHSLAIQPDGKILVGGYYFALNGQPRASLGRLNSDGTLDSTFPAQAQMGVYSLALQPDGKIVVGGVFTNLAGHIRNRLGRLYPDGSVDATLNPGADSQVRCFAAQADGQIVVGGAFTSLGGEPRTRLARMSADGRLDNAFNPWINNVVNSVAVQPDGKLIVAGFFSVLAGRPRERIGRLHADGTLDTNFQPLVHGNVLALALQPDGKILSGGDLPLMARFNPDGTSDGTFWNTGGMPGGSTASSIIVQPDGKILMAGHFTLFAQPGFTNLCRWNPDGTLDASFRPELGEEPYGAVLCMALQPDGRILLGGDFTRLSGRPQMNVGRLNADGTPDTSFAAEANDLVAAMALQADGRIVVGGSFTMLNGTNCNRLGRLNLDGTLDRSFNPEPNDFVAALATQADGKILVGGDFTVLGGLDRLRMGRLTSGSPALQTFTVSSTGTRLRWSRTGSGPEIEQVAFETSLDGINYASIGSAVRSGTGWEQSLAAPFTGMLYVRAQGRVAGGYGAGSRGIAQTVAQFWRLPAPFISRVEISSDGAFRFGFANPQHATFSVLASENVAAPVATWQNLGTSVPVAGEWYEFADPARSNHSRRFYQLHRPY